MKEFKKGKVTLIQADCMDIMKTYKDNHFDLAIVDPPYGINHNNRISKDSKDWDKKPPPSNYFDLLQIV